MQKYLCFPLAKALDSLVGQKISKNPIFQFSSFFFDFIKIIQKRLKKDKRDTKYPKK